MRVPTFVVVEDNPFVAKVHVMLINRIEPDARVVVAKNGLKGLAAVHHYRPAGVIVDVDVPGVNGVQMLNLLAADEDFGALPMIAVTELSPSEVAALGELPPAVSVLSKFNGQLDLLADFVRDAIHAHASRQTPAPLPGVAVESQAEFLDVLRRLLGLKTDRALAQYLSVGPSTISKIRKGSLPVTPFFILRLHDVSGLAVEEISGLLSGGGVGPSDVDRALDASLPSLNVVAAKPSSSAMQ